MKGVAISLAGNGTGRIIRRFGGALGVCAVCSPGADILRLLPAQQTLAP